MSVNSSQNNASRAAYLEVYDDRKMRADQAQDPALKQHFEAELQVIQQMLDAMGGSAPQEGTGLDGSGMPDAAPPSGVPVEDGITTPGQPGPQGPSGGSYDDLIEKYAAQYGISPAVAKAVMAKESQGNSDAVSWAGAAGLMQVKPGTASEVAGRTVSEEELRADPELNIRLGIAYLAKMMREKGNLEDALGAYNQGPNANWRAIAESQEYVRTITASLRTGTLPTWG